jgi:hypothetical protein
MGFRIEEASGSCFFSKPAACRWRGGGGATWQRRGALVAARSTAGDEPWPPGHLHGQLDGGRASGGGPSAVCGSTEVRRA